MYWLPRPISIKVCPDDAMLLLGQGTVSPWSIVPRCTRMLQVLPTNEDNCESSDTVVSYPTLLKALATPWESVEQCFIGTLSLVPRSKVASSGPSFTQALIFFHIKLNMVNLKFTYFKFELYTF